MAVFAIIAQPNMDVAALGARVRENYARHFRLDGNAGWLVSAQTSAQNLALDLGISEQGPSGPAIVIEIKSYWGRANPNTWTWLREQFERIS